MVRDFLQLLLIGSAVRFKRLIEVIRVARRYWGHSHFRSADLRIVAYYAIHNPYAICRRFLQAKGARRIHTYGETPLTTLEVIAKRCGLKPEDHLFELGAGTCRSAFWLALHLGCRVTAIDEIPHFIEVASAIAHRSRAKNIRFLCADFMRVDLSSATALYLNGLCLEELAVSAFARRFGQLLPGAKVVSVGYSLTDYTDDLRLALIDSFPASFLWGESEVYVHVWRGDQ